jgi:predicted nucleic acid-binding protein
MGSPAPAVMDRSEFVTTDYVVDETATLLQARGFSGLLPLFFDSVLASRACRLVWMDIDRFQRTRALFLAHRGRGGSFTDCLSFIVMKELRLREALTKDAHFEASGFKVLLD